MALLTHYFLNLHTSRIGLLYPGLSPEVMALLEVTAGPATCASSAISSSTW